MKSLSGFFAQNKVKKENVFYAASDSFLDENGEPLKWELRCLSSNEDSKLRESCTFEKQVRGKKGQFTKEFNSEKYVALMIATSVVSPDLMNAELQDSYGVKDKIDLLQSMLLPGEYTNLLNKVQEINGFDKDVDDLVEEVKN